MQNRDNPLRALRPLKPVAFGGAGEGPAVGQGSLDPHFPQTRIVQKAREHEILTARDMMSNRTCSN